MHRFDLQDWQWALIADLFPTNDGKAGEPWKDHRTVLNGMFHVLHTGCAWRDVPGRYGKWQTVYDRFNRYRRGGTFDAIPKRLRARLDKLGRIDWDLWCFDGTGVRAARAAAGAKTAAAGPAARGTSCSGTPGAAAPPGGDPYVDLTAPQLFSSISAVKSATV